MSKRGPGDGHRRDEDGAPTSSLPAGLAEAWGEFLGARDRALIIALARKLTPSETVLRLTLRGLQDELNRPLRVRGDGIRLWTREELKETLSRLIAADAAAIEPLPEHARPDQVLIVRINTQYRGPAT